MNDDLKPGKYEQKAMDIETIIHKIKLLIERQEEMKKSEDSNIRKEAFLLDEEIEYLKELAKKRLRDEEKETEIKLYALKEQMTLLYRKMDHFQEMEKVLREMNEKDENKIRTRDMVTIRMSSCARRIYDKEAYPLTIGFRKVAHPDGIYAVESIFPNDKHIFKDDGNLAIITYYNDIYGDCCDSYRGCSYVTPIGNLKKYIKIKVKN